MGPLQASGQELTPHRVEGELKARVRQQAVIVTLGQAAREDAGLCEFFNRAVRLLSGALGVEYVKILELLPDRRPALLLKAGVGWRNGLIGAAAIEGEGYSQAGYTLLRGEPVVVADLDSEERFKPNTLLSEHRVASGLSVIISGEGKEPWGILGAHTSQRRQFSTADVDCLQAAAYIIGEAIRCKNAETSLRQARDSECELRKEVERYARKVLTAQEAERRRIARELHDEVGQVLTGLTMMLERIEQRCEGPLAMMATEARDQAASLLSRVHDLSLDLRPSMLDDFGLSPSLIWLARRYEDQTGIAVQLRQGNLGGCLSPEIETTAYRFVQEALTNVARHAGVDRCVVRCEVTERNLVISVQDHGSGFVMGSFTSGLAGGLAGMQERIRLVGGQFQVTSAPGRGTLVYARLPITGGGSGIRWRSNSSL